VQYDELLPTKELQQLVGRDNVGLIRWTSLWRFEHDKCRIITEEFEENGIRGEKRTMVTPRGNLTNTRHFEPIFNSAATHEHYVKEPDDYDILDAWLDDITVIFDPSNHINNENELGDDGLGMVALPRTAWQQLWVEWVDIMDLSYHFSENEERVCRTMEKMNNIMRQTFDCVCQYQPLLVDFPDNITASMIGPDKFERFCLPFYVELTERVRKTETKVVCHMDGDLKPLWNLIAKSGLNGLDSFSPKPDNDTGVDDALRLWPDKFLMMNFPSSVHITSPDNIRNVTREILRQGGNSGKLQIQLSENVPPSVWRQTIPIIIDEILAFR
jgi:hypothetical protein